MDLAGKRLWQVGAGDTERSYADICTAFDVMIVGPGDPGEFDEERYKGLGDIRNSLRRFYREARRGDVVLLRLGTGNVCAVGEIADEAPTWREAFGDVDGWDLQHSRRVRWLANTSAEFPAKTFGGQVRTFAEVNVDAVRSWVEGIEAPGAERELAALPADGRPLSLAELGKRLFVEGLAGERVDRVVQVLQSLERVATWYDNKDKPPEGRPSEHETVCYLVVPLLQALGWSHQTAAVEWNRVDVALFRSMPSSDATLACVVEAKLLGRSVRAPTRQASNYAEKPGRESCDRLIVTDGIRYALHRRREDGFRLQAYLNVLRLKDRYPVLHCGGAVEAVIGMAPEAIGQRIESTAVHAGSVRRPLAGTCVGP